MVRRSAGANQVTTLPVSPAKGRRASKRVTTAAAPVSPMPIVSEPESDVPTEAGDATEPAATPTRMPPSTPPSLLTSTSAASVAEWDLPELLYRVLPQQLIGVLTDQRDLWSAGDKLAAARLLLQMHEQNRTARKQVTSTEQPIDLAAATRHLEAWPADHWSLLVSAAEILNTVMAGAPGDR